VLLEILILRRINNNYNVNKKIVEMIRGLSHFRDVFWRYKIYINEISFYDMKNK
jgi:hypothetical protein